MPPVEGEVTTGLGIGSCHAGASLHRQEKGRDRDWEGDRPPLGSASERDRSPLGSKVAQNERKSMP
eukprot:6838459-Prymnesium_polylepis.1